MARAVYSAIRIAKTDLILAHFAICTTHQKIENAQSQHFERDAHVAVVIEPIQHSHTQAGIICFD